MSRVIFVSNDKYILYSLSEEDRSNYLKLNAQIEGDSYILKKHSDYIWESVMEDTTNFYSIYDYQEEFCGVIELQKPNTLTPRIGISIVEKHRNKGITPIVVPMFTQKVSELQNVEYFVIQIAKSNSHSKHVFKKMGAELIGEQESSIITAMRKMLERSGGDEKIYKEYQIALEEDDPICVYKLHTMQNYKYLIF